MQHIPNYCSQDALLTTCGDDGKNMTMTMMTDTGAQRSAIFTAPTAMIASLRTRFERYRLYRRTVGELSALSNRELADLGLSRAMIRGLARQAAEEFTAR